MGKILSVAKMVFKKRSLSPTYYWMILAPIVVAIIGICFAKYMQHQSTSERPIIAVVADNNIKKALESKKSTSYQVNKKINTNDSKRLKMYLADGVIDGILHVNKDISKITYKYNANSEASLPINALKNDLASLRSQMIAANYGISAREWMNLNKLPTIKRKILNKEASIELNNSETAQNFSEAVVIVAFFFLTSYISITGAELGNEKGNHLIEGVLAAISPKKHFAGKMLGIGFLVILQLLIYSVIAAFSYIILKHTKYHNWFNLTKYLQHIDTTYVLIVTMLTLFSLAAYIFLSACFASFVSRSEDISQATTSVASIMMIPYFLSFLTQNSPNMGIAKALSYLPFMSQGIMPVRLAQGVASYQSGWVSVLISMIGAVIMYFIAEYVYEKNVFSYNSDAPLRVIFNKVLHR